MTGLLALFTFGIWLIWVYYRDAGERASVSAGSWIVVVWAAIYGSRSVTEWFSHARDSPSRQSSLDEGNPVEALVSLFLITVGVAILFRRRIRLSSVFRENIWLVVFYLFWLMSVTWSDYPIITLKRLFKDLGNVVMVLVVLTDNGPIDAIKAVCTRVAYLCIPLSVILIRYYPDWGRAYVGYDQSELMWVGVATHKNTLGVLAFIGALFLLWDLLDNRETKWKAVNKGIYGSRVLVLLMCWYLLVIANSATSLFCAALGSTMLIILGLPSVKGRPGIVEAFGLASAVLIAILDSVVNVKQLFVQDVLGRDMTLTTRTEVWPLLFASQENPLVGAGFNSFWAGERLTRLFEDFGGIIQAHNGYLETYLNGGFIGVVLLVGLLLAAYARIRKKLALGAPEGRIKFILLILAIIYNNSEASFNKVGLMWFVTLYALLEYGAKIYPRTAVGLPTKSSCPSSSHLL